MARIRVAACQINTVVGDLDGNADRVLAALERAEAANADMAIFPELALTGYPPEDLLLKPGFIADNLEAIEKVASRTGRCAAVVGFVDEQRDLYNAAAVCSNGAVRGVYHKRLLPNYAVFDEQRYFAPGLGACQIFLIAGVRVGVSICEDAWSPAGPIAEQAAGGAELVVNLNASPYYAGRVAERERMLATRATDSSCALVYVNQVGGQDELVFDGASLVFDANGELIASAPQFVEDLMVVDLDVQPVFRKRLLDPRGRETAPPLPLVVVTDEPNEQRERLAPSIVPPLEPVEEVYEALVLGTRDYVHKNGVSGVVIAMSGGIDSSLVACIAVDALGPEMVHGISMPSRYSSEGSKDDAKALCDKLRIELETIPIESIHTAFAEALAPDFEGLADENLQSRIRGVIVMARTNQHPGWIGLSTGNKSEMAVGYSTLYGDTAGGFAVIKDVPKTLVYKLCRLVNSRAGREIVPESVLTKPPSAELRPDQRDDQSLPPYEVLDPVLEAYVEHDLTAGQLIEAGFDPAIVRQVVRLVDIAEYKRRQTPPGVRVTPKAFGKDRRVPITNRYR
jgi:NAD+ synthase (glutamine-hydrolysing)